MTTVKITNFGGITPSVDPRNLPLDGAQVAENLDLRFGDFRPSRGLGTPVTTVAAGVKSIFRTRGGTWLSSTYDVSYVNSQVNNLAQDRVYLTGEMSYAQAWQGGQYRRLGVPAPQYKPTATVTTVSEYSQTDATAAQKAATDAVMAAITGVRATAYIGNLPNTGVAPPVVTPDPLYAQVYLDMPLTGLVLGSFQDLSSQKKLPTITGTGVSFQAGNDGPFGNDGAGYAQFNGATSDGAITFSGITRYRDQADPTWTIETYMISDEEIQEVGIEAWDGNMRKVLLYPTAGGQRTLFSSVHTKYSLQFRGKRKDGSKIAAAGQKFHIAVQCTMNNVEVWIDGEKIGNTPNKESLELDMIGHAPNQSNEMIRGKLAGVRVTMASRYQMAFAPTYKPWNSGLAPTGFWIKNGDVNAVNPPIASEVDCAYLVSMTANAGVYTCTNPLDDYLRTGAFNGAQVQYSGAQYWAIPALNYRAAGYSMDKTALENVLKVVKDPAAPANDLLTPTQAAALATAIAAMYDVTKSPLLGLISLLNQRQAEVNSALASRPGASDVLSRLQFMQTAAKTIESYFGTIDGATQATLSTTLSDIFGKIQSQVVTRIVDTRAYITTFVTDWDEESAPSAVSDLVEADQNDEVKISAAPAPSARNVEVWRLYRSTSGSLSSQFALVEDTAAPNAVMKNGVFWGFSTNNLTYTDKKANSELQEPCRTMTWAEPPDGLKGLVALPNGIMAGFIGNTLYFCEPFMPHAWPIEYQRSVEHEIVALGVFGQTLVVLTKGFPCYASGADSSSISVQKVEAPYPCIASKTVVQVEGGVMYASPDGLCLAGPQGVSLISQGAFSKEDWTNTINADAFAAYQDGSYYLFTG